MIVILRLLRILFVLLLSTPLFAEQPQHVTLHHTWKLHPAPDTAPHYFVKIGAYLNLSHAREKVLSTEFPTFILRMHDYYSVLSRPFGDFETARERLKAIRQQYRDAYIVTLYQRSAITKPPSPSTRLLDRGITAFNQHHYEEALAIFDRILIESPENITARLYYAKTLYQLKFYDEAKKAFERVRTASLSGDVAAEVKRYLARISHKRHRHRVSGWIALGTGYDNNINLTTDKNTTRYGPYLLLNNTRKTKSHFATAEFSLTHQYKAEHFTLINRLYNYNELMHTAKGNDLNFLDLSSTLVKRYQQISWVVPAGGNILMMEGKTISYNLYTSPTLLYQANAHTELRTRLLFNDNHTEYAKKRDYYLLGGGAGIRYHVAHITADLSAALQRYGAKERGRYDVNKDLDRYRLYLQYRLAKTVHIRATGGYDREHYRDLDPVMGYRREDAKHYYLLSATKELTKQSALTASWHYTNNHSNINTFSYIRQNYNIACKYRF